MNEYLTNMTTWQSIQLLLFVFGIAVVVREFIGFLFKTGAIVDRLDKLVKIAEKHDELSKKLNEELKFIQKEMRKEIETMKSPRP